MSSPARVGVWLVVVGVLVLVASACAAPPVPEMARTPVVAAASPIVPPTALAPTPEASRTFTVTNTPQPTPSATRVLDANEALTRPIVNTRVRGYSPVRAARFCEVPQTLRYEDRERVFCLHPETISFDEVVTALGELMNERLGLRDEQGNALVYDSGRRCEFNLCYAYVWYDKENAQNAYALLRLYPLKVNNAEAAPLLELKPGGNPELLGDWQVAFVGTQSGKVELILPNPFVRMARSDTVAFNSKSGYFEVLDRSGGAPKPTGKRLGLGFASAAETQLSGTVEGVALYNFENVDIAYSERSLEWLHENLPKWYDYVLAQRPFEIYRDPTLPFLSDGICCRTRNGDENYGRIRFRDHLNNWTRDSFPGDAHEALTRWSFLTTLIHEATHVRDLRTDRFQLNNVPTEMRDCVMHISTDEIEIQFSQDASAIRISPDAGTQTTYVTTIEAFYSETENNLLPDKKATCGNFYHPTFDGLMP